jgi:uncharacterized protein YjbI with pentapeptide repeats
MTKRKNYAGKHHVIKNKTYPWRGKFYYAVTVMQQFDFNDPDKHFSRKDLMHLNNISLHINKGELFDIGIPKVRGEFLAVGHCYSGPQSVNKSYARITLGRKEKTLAVYGNRYWQGPGVMSEPEQFTKMPLTLAQAFGGAGDDFNPDGKGYAYIEPDEKGTKRQALAKADIHFAEFPDQKLAGEPDQSAVKMFSYPLPNTENPKDLVLSKDDKPLPATFYPIPASNRERTKTFGTFNDKWLKTTWPNFADDMQWSYFNCAYPDQQFKDYFLGDEMFCIENMHPEKAVIKGQLPKWNVRAFIERAISEDGLDYEEIPLKLDTVWFLPDEEQGILVWHGYTHTVDNKASDIACLQVEDESLLASRKTKEYYYEKLKKRQVKPTLEERKAEQDKKMAPHLKQFKLNALEKFNKKIMEAKQEVEKMHARVLKKLESVGQQSDEATKKIMDAKAEMAAKIAGIIPLTLESMADKIAAEKKVSADFIAKFDTPGADLKTRLTNIMAHGEKMKQDKIAEIKTKLPEQAKRIDAALKEPDKAYDPKVTLQKLKSIRAELPKNVDKTEINEAIDTLSGPMMAKFEAELGKGTKQYDSRQAVQAAIDKGEPLTGAYFQLLDLQGLDFSGLDLNGCKFICCDLTGALFQGAQLIKAMFTGSELIDCDFTEANLFQVHLTQTTITKTNFTKADLGHSILSETTAEQVSFYQADLTGANVLNSNWRNIDFSQSTANKIILMKTKLANINFKQATIQHAQINECESDNLDFGAADVSNTLFIKIKFEKLPMGSACLQGTKFSNCEIKDGDFYNTKADKARFSQCTLTDCLFSDASLVRTQFGKCVLNNVKFLNSDLSNTRGTRGTKASDVYFENCQLSSACWMGCDLSEAIFKRCQMDTAIFNNSNLDQSQFLYCQAIDIRLHECSLRQAKFYWSNLMEGILREADIRHATFKKCNLYQVDFYHAKTKQTVMDDNLFQDPLPPNFEDMLING